MVGRVAGPELPVLHIINASSDPHLFQPKREHIRALRGADLVVYSGLHLEGKMGSILEQVADGDDGRKVLALAESLPEDDLIREGEGGDSFDPHVWMSPVLWARTAPVAEQALAGLWPERATEFATNRAAVVAELEELDAYVREVVARIPEERRILVTAHDAFTYFGREYGLRVEGIQGISTDDEAGLTRIRELVDLLVEHKVPAVFAETTVPSDNIRSLREGAASRGHEVVVCPQALFSDAMGRAGTYEGTYIGMIDHNATVIARALGGPDAAPAGGWKGKLPLEGGERE